VIIGDLDSVRDDVRDFYESKGTLIKRITSQDNTDFEKTMIYINQIEQDRGNPDYSVFAMGAFGGRMD
jgi:thiamine pyrophosphokinase